MFGKRGARKSGLPPRLGDRAEEATGRARALWRPGEQIGGGASNEASAVVLPLGQ